MDKRGRRASLSFGNTALQRALKNYGNNVSDAVTKIVVDTIYILQNNLLALMPEEDGNLKKSVEIEFSSDGLSALLTVNAHYAIYVNYGTGIYAVNGDGRKTPWVYWSDKLNRFVYTEGQKPQEFWGPAVDEASRYFRREMRKLG